MIRIKTATACLVILTVLLAAIYLPALYGKLFFERIRKTALFYSPVIKDFIYTEKIVGEVPEIAKQKAEDHHADIAYRDREGNWYTRQEFEKMLPFIYYKNMELWGLLPLHLGGRILDKETIQKNRQVMELRRGDISDHKPLTPLWPLLESKPAQARLVFPADRFRMTDTAMEFVNADYNMVDQKLTNLFTSALRKKGFRFPARSVNGKYTILKPFDEGVFLVDQNWHVFHVKRVSGQPQVVKTPIDPALKTRYMKISESRRREYYGLLLGGDGSLHAMTYDNYRLIPIPIKNYVPDEMDFKLIINPLYRTAIYSDDAVVRALVMDLDYQPIAEYEYQMSRSIRTAAHEACDFLFPYTVTAEKRPGGYFRLGWKWGGTLSLLGILCTLIGFAIFLKIRRERFPRLAEIILILLTGVYGLLAVHIIEES